MIESVTPYNIDEMSIDSIVEYIKDPVNSKLPPKKNRLELIKLMYKILGYDLSPDGALAMVAEPQYQLILAPAGGGKTTQTQIKVAFEKVLWQFVTGKTLYGSRILCLVYNDHNVKPMISTHNLMVTKLKASGVAGFNIDFDVNAMTLHSFCNSWKDEYEVELGMSKHKLIKDNACVELLKSAYNLVSKHFNLDILPNFRSLYAMYVTSKEMLKDYNDPSIRDKFKDVRLEDAVIDKLFTTYEVMKRNKKVYDFIDMLTSFVKLMETNEKAREHVQNYYDYVVADEIQDFTPLMVSILKWVVGSNKRLVCIGDEDQSIYGFKGADVDNTLRFTEVFPGGEVYVLNRNRRCKKNILDWAVHIIEGNENRFNKKILPVKEGGTPQLISYQSEEGQLINIVNEIESMTLADREKTVICYRDKIYSVQLAEMLEQRGIAFNMISGYAPFSHELFRHVQEALDFLYDPMDVNTHPNMYKFLPISRSDLHDVIGYNAIKNKWAVEHIRLHFRARDYGKFETYKKFQEEMNAMLDLSSKIGTEPLSSYFPEVFDKICKYYWNFKKESGNNIAYDNTYTKRVFDFFNSPKTYGELAQELSSRIQTVRRMNEIGAGVTLSTFHGLKGLEYENVYMIYMDDGIFPSTDMENRNSDEKDLQELEESETRLCYVAITRAIDNLKIYYPQRNPSKYVKKLLKYEESKHNVSLGPEWDDNDTIILLEEDDNLQDEVIDLLDVPEVVPQGVSNKAVVGLGNTEFLSKAFKRL